MTLYFKETTRGRGKIFIHLTGTDIDPDARIEASSRTKDGAPLPVFVIRQPDLEGWVLVLAVVRVTQLVTVRVWDAGEDVPHEFTKTVAAFVAKMHSRANTATHNTVTERIRNCDVWTRPQGVFVDFTCLVWNPTRGCDVFRGVISVKTRDRAVAEAPLEMSFLGALGQDVTLEPWVEMGDTLRCEHGVYERRVGYSARIPMCAQSDWLIVWARSPQTDLMDGFVVYESFFLYGCEGRWRDVTVAPGADNQAIVDAQYETWFLDRLRTSSRNIELQRGRTFSQDITFSIVVPLYRTPLDFLQQMIRSVLDQTYPKLELLLVNASPEDEGLARAIAAYAAQDERVRVVELERNEGITANTLRGIAEATGDFVAFLDHDDVIEPDLLYRYMEGIEDHPDTDLLYCDEDKLRDGHYLDPLLKTDWNLDLMRSRNCVCHMLAVRRSILDQLPDDCRACEGALDHYITLFAAEHARNVYHARRVLYHWRIHELSTASGGEAKEYTVDAGRLAVEAHLERCGVRASVVPRPETPNTYRVRYEVEGTPLVSIVIPNKDMVPVLKRCLDSIRDKSTYQNYEIIVVENNSTESATFAYYKELADDARIKVVRQPSDGTFNFSRTINFGVACSSGEYVLLLNNDVEVITPDWLEIMVGQCQRAEVGCVGVKLIYPDNLIQHAGVFAHRGIFDHIGRRLDRDSRSYFDMLQLTQDLSAVTAACLMTKRSIFDAVGGLDEGLPNDFNDTNFCLTLRSKGLLVVYEPQVELYHYESISRGANETVAKRTQSAHAAGIMQQRWPKYVGAGDPYWHPHLTPGPYRTLFIGEPLPLD